MNFESPNFYGVMKLLMGSFETCIQTLRGQTYLLKSLSGKLNIHAIPTSMGRPHAFDYTKIKELCD